VVIMAVKVYWGSGSPYAWRVLLALEEKKIPYEGTRISFDKEENKKPEYLALNPRGKVPVLQNGPDTLYESLAILMYLENKFPEINLLPAAQYSTVLTRTFESDYLPTSASKFYALDTKIATPEQIKEVFKPIAQELDRWEHYLFLSHGPFLFGGNITLADIAIYPQVALFVRFGLDLQKRFPKLNAFYEAMTSRDSVKKTWPPHWAESPKKTTLNNITD